MFLLPLRRREYEGEKEGKHITGKSCAFVQVNPTQEPFTHLNYFPMLYTYLNSHERIWEGGTLRNGEKNSPHKAMSTLPPFIRKFQRLRDALFSASFQEKREEKKHERETYSSQRASLPPRRPWIRNWYRLSFLLMRMKDEGEEGKQKRTRT